MHLLRMGVAITAALFAITASSAAAADLEAVERAADTLGVPASSLAVSSGMSLAELEVGLQDFQERAALAQSKDTVFGQTATTAAAATVSTWHGSNACTGYGYRGTTPTGSTFRGYARHIVDCPALVARSGCTIQIRVGNHPIAAGQNYGVNFCNATTQGDGYTNGQRGVMAGYWVAIATGPWTNASPHCFVAGTFATCTFNSDFPIPGYLAPWDQFLWPPS